MGAVDKGLQRFRGKPLIAHVLERLAPQVDSVVVNANRNVDVYSGFGRLVVSDLLPDYAGPLAGLQAGLSVCETEVMVAVPCDAPFLPGDLVMRLAAALVDATVDVAIARTSERTHPVFCIVRRSAQAALSRYLEGGGRSVHGWIGLMGSRAVLFGDEQAFANLNTVADLHERLPATDDP